MKCVIKTYKPQNGKIFIIRSPGKNDARLVHECLAYCAKDPKSAFDFDILPDDISQLENILNSALLSENDLFIICANNGRAVAAACACVYNDNGKLSCKIMIFVRKAYRKLGIGNALLKEFTDFAKSKSVLGEQTVVGKSDKNSIKFYEENGFSKVIVESSDTITLIKAF